MRRIFFLSAALFIVVLTTVAVVWARRIERNTERVRAPACVPTTFRQVTVTETEIRAQVSETRYYLIGAEKRTVSLHGPDISPVLLPDGTMAATDDATANDFLTLLSWDGTIATFTLKHEALATPRDEMNRSFECPFTVDGLWDGERA